MLSEQIRLQIAGPVEIFTDFTFCERRPNSPPFQPTNHLTDLETMLLGNPRWMGEAVFEVRHDRRVEPRNPVFRIIANDPLNRLLKNSASTGV
ncbi:hypothetical protein P1J78_25110 [Psychromarinibacter sp. C21-152]|uniref:Uncharacterized protein n=1 Tax=Psychromarinibacter sediminicola TaxID=3033385 RepID=A0AAE3NZW3_9RHOB|nr:hypothetical protein [Psychromarinibacter sediminicola]MDF0603990.1 hypothetical protein [Psychromarinibacter sediminicola]